MVQIKYKVRRYMVYYHNIKRVERNSKFKKELYLIFKVQSRLYGLAIGISWATTLKISSIQEHFVFS